MTFKASVHSLYVTLQHPDPHSAHIPTDTLGGGALMSFLSVHLLFLLTPRRDSFVRKSFSLLCFCSLSLIDLLLCYTFKPPSIKLAVVCTGDPCVTHVKSFLWVLFLLFVLVSLDFFICVCYRVFPRHIVLLCHCDHILDWTVSQESDLITCLRLHQWYCIIDQSWRVCRRKSSIGAITVTC